MYNYKTRKGFRVLGCILHLKLQLAVLLVTTTVSYIFVQNNCKYATSTGNTRSQLSTMSSTNLGQIVNLLSVIFNL